MTDHDILAALDVDLPELRPEFRARLLALLDDQGPLDPATQMPAEFDSAHEAVAAPVVGLTAAPPAAQQRRRWMAPLVAAAAVVTLIGTWALVSSRQDMDPASSSPNTTTPITPHAAGTPATSTTPGGDGIATGEIAPAVLPQPTALPGCPPVEVVTVTAADGERTEMALTSYAIMEPDECRQTSFGLDLLLPPPSGGVLVTAADSLTVSGTPEDARVLYGTYVVSSDGQIRALEDGMLTDDPTEPFGVGTPQPFDREIVRDIPLADEPCITVGVRWIRLDVQGAGIIHVARTPGACNEST